MFESETMTCVATLAPASLHMRAAALSNGPGFASQGPDVAFANRVKRATLKPSRLQIVQGGEACQQSVLGCVAGLQLASYELINSW